MPVELEGYIRPGCTILTVFITMPKFMWAKVVVNWMHFLFIIFIYDSFQSCDDAASLTRHISVIDPYFYFTCSCSRCHCIIQDRLH